MLAEIVNSIINKLDLTNRTLVIQLNVVFAPLQEQNPQLPTINHTINNKAKCNPYQISSSIPNKIVNFQEPRHVRIPEHV